jgi:GNAT superfamily N-acetyltransferase
VSAHRSESELALEAALPAFTRLRGATMTDDGDLRRIATGRPDAAFNHVLAIRLRPEDVARRVTQVDAALIASASVPATWWISPSTRPADLGARLAALGLREEEPEFGMVIELGGELTPIDLPPDVTVAELAESSDLTGWTAVMAAAYGWRDPRKAEAMGELYRARPGVEQPWVHVLAHRDGRPVACASLFTIGGHAFVTNVGTIPNARGAGLGSAVTAATLRVAHRAGFSRASLTASLMGRRMYARLGFQEEARIDRYTVVAAS